nr:nuclear transport factor 2 family protein [Mycobacterium sp. 852014-52450_SCH5900713]
MEAGEFNRIGSLFAPDAVLHSPIAHRPYRGPDVIATIVSAVAHVLTGFRFEKELSGVGTGDHALMFRAAVADLESRAATSCTRARTASSTRSP